MARDRIRLRQDSAADWTAQDTVLAAGEPGVELDTNRMKIGDGSTAWTSLEYVDQSIADLIGVDQSELPSQFDSPTLIFKDPLRASVEAASGGRVTVMYDDQDYPSYMVRIPAFNLEDIHADFGTGRHPAFVVNGTEKSEIWIGQHLAYVYNSRAVSLPGLDPHDNVDWDDANTYCTNKGTGWHLMTNWEWAAIALWNLKQVADGILAGQPRGNTNYGTAHDEEQETGTRNDGATYDPGQAIGTAHTLTGSGPATWRHDLTTHGIADLVGNIWEWVGGLKISTGGIYMPTDNYYGQADTAWGDTGKVIASASATTWKTASGILASGTYESGYSDALMGAALILPANVSNTANGSYYTTLTDERMPLRGGRWSYGSNAGLGALNLNNLRSDSSNSIGFRPAFVA